jgi:tetratricopeptide (TPR) repeat protein
MSQLHGAASSERRPAGDAFAAATAALYAARPIRASSLRRMSAGFGGKSPQEIEGELRRYLAAHPDDPDALWLLAKTLLRVSRKREAAGLLGRCLELAPDFAAARYNHADLLAQLARYKPALDELDVLLARDSRNPLFLNLQASILATIAENRRSVAIFERLANEYPSRAESWLSYGHGLRAIGSQPESIAAYRRAIACRPTFGQAYWALANMKTVRFTEVDIAAMQAHLQGAELSPDDRATLQFSLAKAYEDRREYPRSFEQYAKANAAMRLRIGYDPDTLTAGVAATKALFTREFLAARDGSGCQAPDPIFIVGRPRSGSTLIEQILSSHSMIEGTAELPYIAGLASRLANHDGNTPPGAKYLKPLEGLDRDALADLGQEYLSDAGLHRKLKRPFFIDKKPGNFFYLGLIHLILPNARIIDARRHPVAGGFSMFKTYRSKGLLRLTELAQFYRDYVSFMAHFDAVLPGKVHRVIYEQMVADPESEVRRLLEFLGVPFEESCLRFYETERTVLTPSSEQVRRPITKDAVKHWRAYEPFLGPLIKSLGSALTSYPKVPEDLR